MKEYAGGAMLASVGLILLTILTVAPPQESDQIAAIFPPWHSQEAVLEAISDLPYRIIRSGWSDTVLILDISEDPSVRSLLAERALFLADPLVIGGCLSIDAVNL